MARNIAGLSQLKKSLRSIAFEFEDQSEGTLSVVIAGLSQEFIPVDTGHMRKNTYAVKKGGRHYLITNTAYAESQYTMNLYHLYDGQYRSISKAAGIPTPPIDELGGLWGSDTHHYVYWRNYEILKKEGKLTRRKAEWFHKAAAIALNPARHSLRKSFTVAARKLARAGTYYKR